MSILTREEWSLVDTREERNSGNSLVVQWLGLCVFTAEGTGSIPGWGTKIPASGVAKPKRKKEKRKKKEIHLIGLISSK